MKKPRDMECYGYQVAVPSAMHHRMREFKSYGPHPARYVWRIHRHHHLRVLVPGQTWYFHTKDGAVFILFLRNKE